MKHQMKQRQHGIRFMALVLVLIMIGAQAAQADFRHMRMGPRPRSMGSAFVAVANDANSVYWNPAGMTMIERFEITGCRTLLYDVEGLANDYVSAAYNWQKRAAFGVSWVRLGLDDIYYEDTIHFAFAREVQRVEGLKIGLSYKLLILDAPGYEQYNDPSYRGSQVDQTFDVGFHYRASPKWTLGMVIYNVNEPELKLLSTTRNPDPVYRDYAFGASYTFRNMLLTCFDLRTRYGELSHTTGRFGSELWFFDAVALRGGFIASDLTAGMGLKGQRWQLDVMLETHHDLGNTYQFAATIILE
jgi:hypothetical protein